MLRRRSPRRLFGVYVPAPSVRSRDRRRASLRRRSSCFAVSRGRMPSAGRRAALLPRRKSRRRRRRRWCCVPRVVGRLVLRRRRTTIRRVIAGRHRIVAMRRRSPAVWSWRRLAPPLSVSLASIFGRATRRVTRWLRRGMVRSRIGRLMTVLWEAMSVLLRVLSDTRSRRSPGILCGWRASHASPQGVGARASRRRRCAARLRLVDLRDVRQVVLGTRATLGSRPRAPRRSVDLDGCQRSVAARRPSVRLSTDEGPRWRRSIIEWTGRGRGSASGVWTTSTSGRRAGGSRRGAVHWSVGRRRALLEAKRVLGARWAAESLLRRASSAYLGPSPMCRSRAHVPWRRRWAERLTGLLGPTDLLQPALDHRVVPVELDRALVGVDGVGHLVVAGLVQSAEVVPDLGDVRVDPYGARVGVERVVELADGVVEDADRAPERRVLAVPVDGLLVGFVGLAVVVRRHVGPTEQVPAERILSVWMVCKGYSSVSSVMVYRFGRGSGPVSRLFVKMSTEYSGL